ncbi:MAG: DUF1059 domain-containing protein [Deltaproteobacteria bacterium]|nr:DUF1059 domain-containing protein [Deltaproteobacteria bacterium]
MDRKYIDCREFPEGHCSVSLSADSEEELMGAAIEHAVKTHGYPDTPETRAEIGKAVRTGCPPGC